jgi:hypothetical protein
MKIDFTRDPKLLTEAWLSTFGEWNKTFLKYIYGKDVDMIANLNEDESSLEFKIIGRLKDVRAYSQAIMAEKNYLESYVQHGKDAPMTVQTRDLLGTAVSEFENITGITWPFSDEG